MILMAWGLWERISIFGLTESRYFITVLWLWFVASTLIIFIRVLNPALWIIGTFSGLFLISSFSPWNIQELPIHHQLYKLKTTLSEIRSAEKSHVTKQQRIIVSSILDYLNSRHRLNDVRKLYLNPNASFPSEKLISKDVSLELGVHYIEYAERAVEKNVYPVHYKVETHSLPINEYSYMIPNIKFSTYGTLSHSIEIKGLGSFTLRYIPTEHSFEIIQKGVKSPVYKAYLLDLIQKLASGSKNTLQINPKLTTQTHNGLTIQVIFTEAFGITNNNPTLSSSINSLRDISCIVLIHRAPKK